MAPRVLTFKSVRMVRTSLKMRKGTDIMGKRRKERAPYNPSDHVQYAVGSRDWSPEI